VLYLRFGSGADRDTWADELFAPAPEEQKAAPTEARTSMTQRFRPAIAALPITPVLLLSGCAGAVADKYTIEHEPASVASIAGTNQVQVRLDERAAQRLGIQTMPVRKDANRLVVPSSAVFVDPQGAWWVYINPKPLVFVRHKIALAREEGDLAYLSSGPPPGTKVVTRGVQEVHGVEVEVSH
jgi:hypothetical protein